MVRGCLRLKSPDFSGGTSMGVLVQSLLRLQKSVSEWVSNQILNSFMSKTWFQNLSLYLCRVRNFPRVERKP